MGMYDYIKLEDGVPLPPDFPEDNPKHGWQTKEFERLMRTYRITEDGRLLEERFHTETVPEENRPMYDEKMGGFEKDFHELFGSMNWVTDGWEEVDFHGIIRFGGYFGEERGVESFEAKFTDGRLEEIRREGR